MAFEDFQKFLGADYLSAASGQPLQPGPVSDYASRLRGLSEALSVDFEHFTGAEISALADGLASHGSLSSAWTAKRRGDTATALRRFAEFKGAQLKVAGYNPFVSGEFKVAVTDLRWHAQLLDTPLDGFVNFWTPTLWKPKLKPGSQFFFMLKAPVRKIGGYGYVVGYKELTPAEAWRRWGRGNGVESTTELETRVTEFADKRSSNGRIQGSMIGCIVLRDCVFLDSADQRTDGELGLQFPNGIVKYKYFDGALVLPVEQELPASLGFALVSGAPDRTIGKGTRKLRAQQAIFRGKVLDAYGSRCAFMGTPDRDVLDAAHIQPYLSIDSNHIQNGIALRKDVHALFDAGLLALNDDYEIRVSSLLRGRPYHALAGKRMRLPSAPSSAPSLEAIRSHRKNFRA